MNFNYLLPLSYRKWLTVFFHLLYCLIVIPIYLAHLGVYRWAIFLYYCLILISLRAEVPKKCEKFPSLGNQVPVSISVQDVISFHYRSQISLWWYSPRENSSLYLPLHLQTHSGLGHCHSCIVSCVLLLTFCPQNLIYCLWSIHLQLYLNYILY